MSQVKMLSTRENVIRQRERRRALLERELDRLVGLLIARSDVRRVILFGSLASGNVGKRSDLDLVVVAESKRTYLERLQEFLEYLRPRTSIDLFVYTPLEWEELKQKRPFTQWISARGKVIYETGS